MEQNPNRIHAIDSSMPKNTDIPTTETSVYRQIPEIGLEDIHITGVVRSGRDIHNNPSKTYGTDVYWTQGATGMHHNVQDGRVVLEAPHAVASERRVKKEDLLGVYWRNSDGVVEFTAIDTANDTHDTKLKETRARLGLSTSDESSS